MNRVWGRRVPIASQLFDITFDRTNFVIQDHGLVKVKIESQNSLVIHTVATLALGSRPRQGVARKPGSQKEGSPGARAKALEGCGPRGGSPGVITYSRESKEVRGSVRE